MTDAISRPNRPEQSVVRVLTTPDAPPRICLLGAAGSHPLGARETRDGVERNAGIWRSEPGLRRAVSKPRDLVHREITMLNRHHRARMTGTSRVLRRSIATLAAGALLLAACGDADEPSEDVAEEPADDADEAPADDAADDAAEEAAEDETEAAEPDPDVDPVVFRFNHILGEGSFITDSVVDWADEITARTDGRVSFEHFFGSSLLPTADITSGLRDGRAEGVYYSASYTPQESPLMAIVTAAGIDDSPEVQIRTMTELVRTNELLQAELAANGGIGFTTAPLAPYVLAAAEPIESLSDLQGLRARVTVPKVAEAFEELGASTTFTDSAEVYESVQRGLLDAVSFPFDLIVGTGVYEVAPHVTGVGRDVNNVGTLVLSLEQFEQLSPEDQQVIYDVSDEFLDQSMAALDAANSEACDTLLASGGSSRMIPDDELEEFAETLGDSGIEQWRDDAIAAGVSEADADAFLQAYRDAQELFADVAAAYVHPAEECAERSG